ncbi:MAG TPA: peptidoglycan-binding protein [Steroidobacteraceae bacterium]
MRRTAKDVVRLARRHVGEPYVLGARAPMAAKQWHGPWDCAEFASWCLYRTTGVLYGVKPENDPLRADAYTGWWIEQARRDRATVPLAVAVSTPGAFLLRAAAKEWVGHIVISDGQGGTIEAHSSRDGVILGTVEKRRWDYGVIVPGVPFVTSDRLPAVKVTVETLRLKRPMMTGVLVKQVQRALRAAGFAPGPIDGEYGPQTAHAVQQFQDQRGLVADGEVGPATLRRLRIKVPGWAKTLVAI